MKKNLIVLFLFGVSFQVGASVIPTGEYTLTLQRGAWNATGTIAAHSSVANYETLTTSDGQTLYVYMMSYAVGDVERVDWFVNTNDNNPATSDYRPNPLIGGNPNDRLTITISGLMFDGVNPNHAIFQTNTTHVYYRQMDGNGNTSQQEIPGWALEDSSNPNSPKQRSPIGPVLEGEQGYKESDSFYGTAYRTTPTGPIVLPDMFVPLNNNHEVAFGIGYAMLPEPITLLMMCLGILPALRRKS